MWTIWKEELYKIASRKLVWLGVSLLLAFVTFRLYSEQNTYSSTIDGKTYRGAEAIKKDQELTRLYAGTLTLDKVKQIYEEYGFFFYDKDDKTRLGNYCNWFISKEFTNFMQTDGYDPGQVHFYTGQDWEFNAEPLLHGGIRFDYIYGWSDLAEIYLMTIIVLFILLIIGLTPLFSEEYQLKTADILRTTRRGRQSGIWMKILAALFFSVVLVLAVTAYLWGIYLDVYGTQGLDASSALLSFAYGYYPETAAGFLVFLFFLGLAGAILLTGLLYQGICPYMDPWPKTHEARNPLHGIHAGVSPAESRILIFQGAAHTAPVYRSGSRDRRDPARIPQVPKCITLI